MLVLLIASVGCHLALQGLGLVFFGAEGLRGPALSNAALTIGPLRFTGQSIAVYGLTIAFIVGLWLFFGFTLMGKALRATAVNRLGARLVGIRTTLSGQIAFLLASVIGAISGILIVPITTLYYDTGFLIGLKGFIAAIIGGLVSYPLTAVAALRGRLRRGVLVVLCQQLQGGHRLHADPSRAGAALARGARGRRREGLSAMTQRLPLLIFALVMAAIPFIPGMPPFWIVLLDNIGLAALVAMGLVLLTGVGGLTSFGQAAFCGFGAYTTAVLTTAYGVSPWLTLPLSLLVSGIAAVLLGLVTVRLSGHYLPLGTIAWGIGLFYLFSKLEFLGRNDGISGIPPLSIGSLKMLDPGTIYFAIWIAVLVSALLTMNLLDSRTGRAIRALRRGHIAAEAFGVQTPRAKLLVFIYAAVLAGLSGWLYAHFQRAANPTPFGAQAGIEYLFIAVVGGAGYVWGGVLGAGDRRDPERGAAELPALYFRRPEPARDHRVRHPAGRRCCNWRRPASGPG